METPINRRNLRPRHVPTPKMSERKKSLFPDGSKSPVQLPIDEDSDLGPISPLNFSSSSSQSSHHQYPETGDNTRKVEFILTKKNLRISFRNILNNINGSKSNVMLSSPKSMHDENEEAINFIDEHIGLNDNATDPYLIKFDGGNKENISLKTPSEQIKTTPNIEIQPKFRRIALEPNDQTPTSDEPAVAVQNKPQKRHYISTTPKSNAINSHTGFIDSSPKMKLLKIDSKARTSLSFDEFIPTKSFYSSSKNVDDAQIAKIKSPEAKSISKCNLSTSSDNYRRSSFSHRKSIPRKGSSNTINRGVFHRVVKKRPKSFRGLVPPTHADTKFNAIKLKLLKKSILLDKTDEERENTRITMEQVQRINNILRNMKNPIEMAQPLTALNIAKVNDEMESIVDTERDLHDFDDATSSIVGGAAKKFFKSQKSSGKNIYRITNRLSASVESGGRISLLQRKPKIADFSMEEIDFTDERKEVEGIIDKLYDQLVHDDQDDHDLNTSVETDPEHVHDEQLEYFRSKLPHTVDANELERQENLLQFLTMNYMLDDYHFKVFILEPNKHSEEAKAILDQLVVVDDPSLDTTTTENEFNSDCPMSPTSQISNMTSELVLECPMDTEDTNLMQLQQDKVINNNNNDESVIGADSARNFLIFDKGYRDTTVIPVASKSKRAHKMWIPIGADQYQIDAGQKRFGATKCSECGLLYSANEPEEEIIHLNFHNSLKLLRYKGWQNERAIAEVAEWGLLGRIIMIVGSDPKFQLNRAKSIMRLADRDLGFSSVDLHANSVVYLAIGKNIIMGFCVAEPIPKAYRLVEDAHDGVSYDVNKPVPIKCGISKIWVAEAFRNQGVARHLVNAVRSNFVFGYCLSFDELAFSSPTESGKKLAKKLMNRSDILIYE